MTKPAAKTDYQCSLVEKCVLLRNNETKMPELVNRIRQQYCKTEDFCQCARFHIYESAGLAAVPPLMLPDQFDWSRQIIEEYRKGFETDAQPADV